MAAEIKLVTLEIKCPICNKGSLLTLTYKDFVRLTSKDELVTARNFPDLSPSQRELLITGICPECWDEHMKDED